MQMEDKETSFSVSSRQKAVDVFSTNMARLNKAHALDPYSLNRYATEYIKLLRATQKTMDDLYLWSLSDGLMFETEKTKDFLSAINDTFVSPILEERKRNAQACILNGSVNAYFEYLKYLRSAMVRLVTTVGAGSVDRDISDWWETVFAAHTTQ